MHYLYALRNVRTGWSMADRRRYFQILAQTESYTGGQGMNDFLQRIRTEATATLTDEEREAIGPLTSDPSQIETQARL